MQKHIAFCGAVFAGFASLMMAVAGQGLLALMLLLVCIGLLALDREDPKPPHFPLTRVF